MPDSIKEYLKSSILGRAQKKGLLKISLYNPRDYTENKHKKLDARPYGGGPGMVLQAEPILKAVEKARGRKKDVKILIMTPHGKELTNKKAKSLTGYKDLIIISGRYEGIDARVKKILKPEEISIGNYVLAGGEIPALAVTECIARQISGVLGEELSVEEKREVAPKDTYTRPEEFKYKGKKYKVPKILLSGHHKNIEKFHKEK